MNTSTFIIRCDGEIVAKNVYKHYVSMIIESLLDKYYLSAAAGDLNILIEAEKYEVMADPDELDDILPF